MELHCRWSAVFQLQHVAELWDWPKLISFGHCIRGLNLNAKHIANNNFNIPSTPLHLNYNTCWARLHYKDNLSGSLHFSWMHFIYNISSCYLFKIVDTPISHVCICTYDPEVEHGLSVPLESTGKTSLSLTTHHKCKILISSPHKTHTFHAAAMHTVLFSPCFGFISLKLFSPSSTCTPYGCHLENDGRKPLVSDLGSDTDLIQQTSYTLELFLHVLRFWSFFVNH